MKGQTSIGSHRHLVSLHNPTVTVSGGDVTVAQTGTALNPPTWHCSLMPATARDLERVIAGTVVSSATHIATGRYHAGISTQTQLILNGRVFSVKGVANPEERNLETVVVCSEVVV